MTRYVYGADDRLVGVALPGGGGSAFEYDANGLRVKKADSAGTTRYLLDGLSVVGQYGADGARQAFYVQSLARIDEVLSVVNGQGKHWYQADALGSIYTLTTAAGEVRARGGYDVFGAPVAESGAAVGQPFGFTGREHELDSALVYARARFLNPAIGGWMSKDPADYIDGPGLYQYVFGNPVVLLDPSGLAAVGDVVFFNWRLKNWPEHAAVVTAVDRAGTPTRAFGARGDTMTFHEVDLSAYSSNGLPAEEFIIGTGDMNGLTAMSVESLVKTWTGKPVAHGWDGYKGLVCIDVVTSTSGYGGGAIRTAMKKDAAANPDSYPDIDGTDPDPSNPMFYRRNSWLWPE